MLRTVQRMLSRRAAHALASGHRCFSQIPVIDVSALVRPNSSVQAQQKAAAALHEAARCVGFFYAANTGVPAELCDDILKQARQWFDLPVGSPADHAHHVTHVHPARSVQTVALCDCRRRQSSR
jgi:isopenicillin N synthase-like dioxygenase